MDFVKEFDEPPQKFDARIWILTAIVIFLPILSIILLAIMSGTDSEVNTALQKIGEGNVKFTKSIYKELSKKDGNIFISPLSVEVVLALAYMGARGTTADEIAMALHLPDSKDEIKAGFRMLMESLKSTENMTLEIANKIYSKLEFKIEDEFRSIAEKDFLSGAEELDFDKEEESRKTINTWVEEKTRDKIKDLIPAGILSNLTRLVLVNAIYFKGLWKNQFDTASTKPEKFHLNSTAHKMIPMMHKKANFGYSELPDLNATVLRMDYQGQGNMSMFVILPNEIEGISYLEEKLETADLPKILSNIPKREVVVTMPKFKLEESTDFDDILKAVGIETMYDKKNADFGGISTESDLYVSKVLQKAFIEVNEQGSEAAAATGVMMMLDSLPRPSPKFLANHPFIFILQDQNRSELFIGRFSQPND